MASVYDKYYERQPATVKVIVVAGLGLLGYAIYRAIKGDESEKNAKVAPDLANAKLKELAAKGVLPSYDDLQFQVFVESLVQAMEGCGTDEELIYKVFQAMQNDADISKLIAMFDIQYIKPCEVSSPLQWLWSFVDRTAFGGNLPTWIAYDLSASNISTINSILEANGVNYQF